LPRTRSGSASNTVPAAGAKTVLPGGALKSSPACALTGPPPPYVLRDPKGSECAESSSNGTEKRERGVHPGSVSVANIAATFSASSFTRFLAEDGALTDAGTL
jgi:hypothetical protein